MQKNKATISADIVSSTAMSLEDRLILEQKLLEVLKILQQTFGSNSFARLIKGDYIECVLENPQDALQAALILKSFVKSLNIAQDDKSKKIQDFKQNGIKIVVGIGELSVFNKEKGIIDGEAIYLSGRDANKAISKNKKNKKTLIFKRANQKYNDYFEAIFSLLDFHFSKLTRTQSEVIYYKLLGKSEKEIAKITKKSQPAVNKNITSSGWWVIDVAITAFKNNIE